MEIGASQAQVRGPPQEEPGHFQVGIPTGTLPQTEEGSEEREERDREAGTTIIEPRQPSPGRERARKWKTSQDRELTKLNTRPSERREDKVRDEPGSGPLELIKKMG